MDRRNSNTEKAAFSEEQQSAIAQEYAPHEAYLESYEPYVLRMNEIANNRGSRNMNATVCFA